MRDTSQSIFAVAITVITAAADDNGLALVAHPPLPQPPWLLARKPQSPACKHATGAEA